MHIVDLCKKKRSSVRLEVKSGSLNPQNIDVASVVVWTDPSFDFQALFSFWVAGRATQRSAIR